MTKLYHLLQRKSFSGFKPAILVTGCGSGIGLAIAKLLHKNPQYRVCVTARGKNYDLLLSEFKQDERFIIRSMDVTSLSDRKSIVTEINNLWGGVDILINNAGVMYRSVVEHMTEEDEANQMATNYFGPMSLIRLVLPSMRARGRGKIINISSVSGMLAMPTMASYSASKHALEGASEALWYETKPFGIDVSLVQPGFIRSNSFRNVYRTELYEADKNIDGPYNDFYSNMESFVEKLMRLSPTTPEKIAEDVLRLVKTQNPLLWNSVTLDAVLFYYLRRLMPRRLLLPFLYALLPNAKSWGLRHTKRRMK